MKETRIMVYCDGSYRDNKGGWSFLCTIQDHKEYTVGYGCGVSVKYARTWLSPLLEKSLIGDAYYPFVLSTD